MRCLCYKYNGSYLEVVGAQLLRLRLQQAEEGRVLDAGHLQHLRRAVADVALVEAMKE